MGKNVIKVRSDWHIEQFRPNYCPSFISYVKVQYVLFVIIVLKINDCFQIIRKVILSNTGYENIGFFLVIVKTLKIICKLSIMIMFVCLFILVSSSQVMFCLGVTGLNMFWLVVVWNERVQSSNMSFYTLSSGTNGIHGHWLKRCIQKFIYKMVISTGGKYCFLSVFKCSIVAKRNCYIHVY